MAHITISAEQWLAPLTSLSPVEVSNFRDSCLFGIHLVDGIDRKRLAGFGYGMSYFIRTYISGVKSGSFYTNLHEKYGDLIPDMPLSRYEQGISISETYLDLCKDAERFKEDKEMFDDDLRHYLIYLQNLFAGSAELRSICRVVRSNYPIMSRIGGEIISCELFSRMHLNSAAEGFRDRIDPTLSFSKDGYGELSFFPVDYWSENRSCQSISPWCVRFEMNAFRYCLESCLYLFSKKIISLGGEVSDDLRSYYLSFIKELKHIDELHTDGIRVPVTIQPEYIFEEKHWRY